MAIVDMLPYSRELILDSSNNYGIVKTETVFGFHRPIHHNYVNNSFNATEHLDWIFSHGDFGGRSLGNPETPVPESRALKTLPAPLPQARSKAKLKAKPQARIDKKTKKKIRKKLKKKLKKRKSKGVKKCIFKVLKKGGKKHRGGNKVKMHKKYMMPMIIGLLAAKSLLIPVAMKALAFISAKGLMMGFFSTVMASVLSLKGMFDHSHYAYANRKDDTKTQVEIIQVPSKSEDHVYYNDEHYRRGDYNDEHYKRGDYIPLPMPIQ